jgi:hypothetical protein
VILRSYQYVQVLLKNVWKLAFCVLIAPTVSIAVGHSNSDLFVLNYYSNAGMALEFCSCRRAALFSEARGADALRIDTPFCFRYRVLQHGATTCRVDWQRIATVALSEHVPRSTYSTVRTVQYGTYSTVRTVQYERFFVR